LRTTFSSEDQQITIDLFPPERPGSYPIVCALHGSGGLQHAGHLEFAQLLANQGFFVCVPHYFESTGTYWADSTTIWREFPTWMRAISDGLDYTCTQPKADCSRIALVGFSLGAYLALSLGSEQSRIGAIVDFFGGMPDHFGDKLQQIAPVLILHGETDPVVPVSEAHKLARLLDRRSFPYEMKLYPNAGHGFRGFDMMDAGQRTFHFLRRHLSNGA